MDNNIFIAACGGLTVNVLQLMEIAKLPKKLRPEFKDWLFWLPYVFWPILGGALAYTYMASGITLSPIVALNIGLSAPLTIRAMTEANPLQSSAPVVKVDA